MPRYDYKCNNCNNDFFVILGINDNKENIPCSDCESKNTSRVYNFKILKTKFKDQELKEENIKPEKIHEHKHEAHDHSQCSPELDYM